MFDQLDALKAEALGAIEGATDEAALRELEVHYLGRKGAITAVLKGMGSVPKEERPKIGQHVNVLRGGRSRAPSQAAARRSRPRASRPSALTRPLTRPSPVRGRPSAPFTPSRA